LQEGVVTFILLAYFWNLGGLKSISISRHFDGGHMVLNLYEWIPGKELIERVIYINLLGGDF